jgi:hypothetical protein
MAGGGFWMAEDNEGEIGDGGEEWNAGGSQHGGLDARTC